MKTALLLALVAVWFLAPDLALAVGSAHPAVVQYAADGFFGAALALIARDVTPPDWGWLWRAICDAAAVLWVMHPVCELYAPANAAPTASICDDASGIPGSAIVVCLLAAAAGWLLDAIRRG